MHDMSTASLPVDPDEVLPLHVDTLDHIPLHQRGQYRQGKDGSFKLAWVTTLDSREGRRYLDQVATGAVRVLPEGETVASVSAAEEARVAGDKAVKAELARLEAADRQAK